MRVLFAAALLAVTAFAQAQDNKGTPVELAGFKSTTPADWKSEQPESRLRMAQFKLPKTKGDSEDAELAIFALPGGGSIQQNLERQEKKFELPADAKEPVKTEKFKFGGKYEAVYQDISGTYLKKFPPFAPNAKITKVPGHRQLYVIFEVKEGDATTTYSMTLLGPAKTIEKHRKGFEEWVKSFK